MHRFLTGCFGGAAGAYIGFRLTQALRARRDPPAPLPRDPAQYGRYRRARMLIELLLGHARRHAFVTGGGAAAMRRWLRTGHPAADAALSSAVLIVLGTLIDLPSDYTGGLLVERRYGLSAQSDAAWLADRAKATGVALALGPALAALLSLAQRRFPRGWPYLASAALLPLSLLANVVGPLYLAPLFNRYEPLQGALSDRLRALARRAGVTEAAIYRVDMSRQTEKANAFVTGLFGARRIVVGDTLLRDFDDDEILWVVAHELGHDVRRDVWRSLALALASGTLVIFAGRALAARAIARDAAGELGLHELEEPAAIPLLLHQMALVAGLLGPFVAAISREIEWGADRFARAALPGQEGAGVRALERLRERNLAEDEEPRWAELLFSSHPSLRARIAALRRAPPSQPR
ncbi:MAG: M48 family metalloprotease [bacterium]|nr:M48 family metalloprotease [bacterium]